MTKGKNAGIPPQDYFQRQYHGELDGFVFETQPKRTENGRIYFGKRKTDDTRVVLKEVNKPGGAEATKDSLRLGIQTGVYPHPIFANPLYVPATGPGYVIEYVSGHDVDELLRRNLLRKPEDFGKAVLAYATAMKQVHAKKWLMGDNNWGAVMFSAHAEHVVDLDTIAPIERHNNPFFPYFLHAHPDYFSEEQVEAQNRNWSFTRETPRLPHKSELHSFAIMIEALFHKGQSYRVRGSAIDAQNIPENLREILTPILVKPRVLDCTIDDFIEAAKLDFGL